MLKDLKLYATCPLNVEDLLTAEIEDLGGINCKISPSGVSFVGDLKVAYRVCLESRIAGRLFLELFTFNVEDPEDLYRKSVNYNWDEHFGLENTFATSAVVVKSRVKNSQFASLRVKDAIADFFRLKYDARPNVDSKKPDVKIHLHVNKNLATVSLDLSGDSLHKRGYRQGNAKAAIKENVAAAFILRSNWKDLSNKKYNFLDPMCGSGTLLIEATLIATRTPPGYRRFYYGFIGWKQHDADLWDDVFDAAEELIIPYEGSIRGYDIDSDAISVSIENIRNAGFASVIHVEKQGFEDIRVVESQKNTPGLICINPPYGVRLGEQKELINMYNKFGTYFLSILPNWELAVISGDEDLIKSIPLRINKKNIMYNGELKCTVSQFSLTDSNLKVKADLSPGGEAFKNRLIKKIKHLNKWAKRNNITCFRVYDADLPDYNVSIDLYEHKWAIVSEYQAPKEIEERVTKKRLSEILEVVPNILEISPEDMYLKVRKQQKGSEQYYKSQDSREYEVMYESGAKFYANFKDYLDTGIFLDHRPIRKKISEESDGKSFLNLFCYTGTATVLAALGGAKKTISVDASQRYLDWAKRNLTLNGLYSNKHFFFQSDSRDWLKNTKEKFDIIFLDPPTFSNSKSGRDIFNVQDDYIELINLCSNLLELDGVLYFSNNFRKFKFDNTLFPKLIIRDISLLTIDEDFKGNPKIHRCWEIKWNQIK